MNLDPKRVEAVFAAALDKTESEARRAFVNEACGGDEALRARVLKLLEAHAQASGFLNQPASGLGDSAVLDTPTQALDATSGPLSSGNGDSENQRTEADPLRSAADDVSFLEPSAKPGSLGRLDHYEIQEVLGRGGFGTVFKAFDEMLHRVVAIKVLAPEMAASSAARSRFLREARAAAAVRDEHVVDIHAVVDEKLPYLVMEFINGQTLQEKLNETGPLGVKEILRIGMQIARGMAAAHKQGLIHRDIKPGNILLENGIERVKITDFGLARAMDDASITQSGLVAGTPMYMSPEQAEGLTLDHRSDLFSLGTVLYVMCTGRPPFRASGTIAVLRRVVEGAPRPIREINSDIPQWLCDVVEKLHAKKPEDRYQSAAEVAEVLGNYLAEMQLHGGVGQSFAQRAALPGAAAAQPAPRTVKDHAEPTADHTPPKPAAEAPECFPPAVRLPFGLLVAGLVIGLLHAVGASTAERAAQGITTLLGFAALYLFGLYALAGWQSRRRRGWHATLLGAAPWAVTLTLFGLVLLNAVVLATRTQGLSAFLPIWARPRQEPDATPSGAVHLHWSDPEITFTIRSLATGKSVYRSDENKLALGGPVQLTLPISQYALSVSRAGLFQYEEWFFVKADEVTTLFPSKKTDPGPQVSSLAIAPFDAAQAKKFQEAWAKRLGMPVEFTNAIGMKLRLIPPGKNGLGPWGAAESAEPLFVGVTEVTVSQFRHFVQEMKHRTAGETDKLGGMLVHAGKKTERDSKYVWNNPEFARSDNHPVTLVTWHDAMAFCEWLRKKDGRVYRLPTAAEWRWAARAGSAAPFYFNDSKAALDDHGWHVGNSDMHTHVVAAKQPNPWGLFDIYGNVWEINYDWQRDGTAVRPTFGGVGPSAGDRIVFQGGGYSASADNSLEPHAGPPLIGYSHLGFRVVSETSPKAPPEQNRLSQIEPPSERLVADWVLNAGGTLVIRAGGTRVSIDNPAVLPDENLVVESVDLSKSRTITEATLGALTGAKGLRELSLRSLPIGEGGVSQLLALEKLEKLDLGGTKITDRGLVILSEARSLKSLNLENTAVGDGALRLLEETKQLERLQGLPLTELNLKNTAFTAEGVQALAKALPKCRILSDHGDFGR